MAPISLRLTPELKERLEAAAERLGVPKHTLAQWFIEAGIKAAETNDYNLVLPIKLVPAAVAVANREAQPDAEAPEKPTPRTSYPSHRSQASMAEDVPAKVAKPKKAA